MPCANTARRDLSGHTLRCTEECTLSAPATRPPFSALKRRGRQTLPLEGKKACALRVCVHAFVRRASCEVCWHERKTDRERVSGERDGERSTSLNKNEPLYLSFFLLTTLCSSISFLVFGSSPCLSSLSHSVFPFYFFLSFFPPLFISFLVLSLPFVLSLSLVAFALSHTLTRGQSLIFSSSPSAVFFVFAAKQVSINTEDYPLASSLCFTHQTLCRLKKVRNARCHAVSKRSVNCRLDLSVSVPESETTYSDDIA